MTRNVLTVAMTLVILTSGCSRNAGLRCENQERYSGAVEVAPLRIPDDLDPPTEIEALNIPQTGASAAVQDSGARNTSPDLAGDDEEAQCTEAPPDFFQEDIPG